VEAARPATTADIPVLVDLARALRAEWRTIRGGSLWATREAPAEPLDSAFGAFLARDDACVVVGMIDRVVVGYGIVEIETLRDDTRLGIIGELYVEPDARAVSVGETIADALVAFCSDQGCFGIDARALPGHREAKNFFERAGFTARALIMYKGL
jgi:GNAT superfamily N-acetyltransferase